MQLVVRLALVLLGAVRQAASQEQWTRVFKCTGETANGVDRLDYKVMTILALAQNASRVRICTTGNSSDCATSVAGSFPILMLRQGRTISHNGTSPCDATCVAATWTGPRNAYLWNNAYDSNYMGNDMLVPGNPHLLFEALGNSDGLYIALTGGQLCRWNRRTGEGQNIEVFLDIPTPQITEPYQNVSGDLNYHLVALTNHQFTYGYGNTPVDWYYDPSDPAVGDYVKPVPGTYTRLRYECGYRLAGVLGYIELVGNWEWAVGGLLAASSSVNKVQSNLNIDTMLPGFTGAGDWMWTNKRGSTFANFGVEGFAKVDGILPQQISVFTCNPGAVTNSWGEWAPSGIPNDVRFIRLWLAAPAPAPHYSFVDSSSKMNYTLVAVTNGGAASPRANQLADSSDPAVGEYVKPLYGVFTRLRYECGYQTAGVLGVVELEGRWTWTLGSSLLANGNASVVTNNALWAPKLPGYAGDGDQPWTNVKGTVRAPTFGMGGFWNVDGQQWTVSNVRSTSFACDPQVQLPIKLELASNTGYFVNAAAGAQATWSNSAYTAFKMVPGLADPGAKSLQPVASPGYFLRDNGGRLTLEASDGTSQFNFTATWWIKPSWNGLGGVSFQSFDDGTKWIRITPSSTLTVTAVSSTADYPDASFNIRYESASANGGNAWAPSSAPGDVKYVRLWLSLDDSTTTTTTTMTQTTSTATSTTTQTSTITVTTTTSTTTQTSTSTVTTTTSTTSQTSTTTVTTTTTTTATTTTTTSSTATSTSTTSTTATSSTTTSVTATSTTTTSTTTITVTSTSTLTTTTSTTLTTTTSTSTGPVDVASEVAALLKWLQSPGGPDRLTQSHTEANITVLNVTAGTTLPGGYLGYSVGGAGTVQLALPPALLQTLGAGAAVSLVSLSRSANFSEGGGGAGFPDFNGVESVVSIRVWKGGFLPVNGLLPSSPIVVMMPRSRSSAADTTCAYWDAEARRWSSQGLVEGNSTEDTLVCATTHLTFFGVVLKEILAQLECTNIKVLTAEGLEKLDDGWPTRAPAILLWVLLACGTSWVLYGLWADHQVRKRGLWQDAYYLTYLPEHKRTPLGPAYCAFLAASLVGVCRAAPRQCCGACCARRSGSGRPNVMAALWRWVVTRVTVTGVLSIVAVRNGVSMEEVREHVWGPHGFVQVQVARQGSEQLCRKLDSAQMAVPAAFREFFTMCFCARFALLLRAVHPLCGIGRLALTLSAAKRAKLIADALLGALVINALFFSATGSAMSIRSPAACATERLHPIRFILVGLVSSLLVKVPLMVVANMHLRAFVHEEHFGPQTARVRLRFWRGMDCLFWLIGLVWTGFCVFFLVSFLSNLHGKDDVKWIIAFFSTIFRMMVVWPCILAWTLAVAAAMLAVLQPDFVTHGDPRFGFEPTPAAPHFKVEELAKRSMSVGDLLDFYAMLGTKEVMRHFDPDRSTTHDVVRQAIIPLSRRDDLPGGGAAYATLVANGKERLAEKMVTHNWGNKFSHLCAAILADCLGHQNYSRCLAALARGPAGVAELRFKARAKLHKTYWVCAFCVNQHAGICAAAPPTDSTGYPIEKCTCPHEKYTSGDLCEMNKFDDMMNHLRAASPGFTHVIAVDTTFVVFNRIWCVAEILGGFHLRLPQTLKIESQECVDKHKDALSAFDVRMAESSVPEDKEHILSKVDDKEAFNRQLKELVLDPLKGLLAMWSATGVMASTASAMLEEGGNVLLQQLVDLMV